MYAVPKENVVELNYFNQAFLECYKLHSLARGKKE
jgi:hypothetical protein